jgi:transcriptional regulator with XRE-family HTH domain
MSQRQLAQQSGVDHSTISRLIRGDRMPSLGTATKLARGLREIHDDAEPPQYLGVVSAGTTNPVARVEYALRADELLNDADVRQVMEYYLSIRLRRFGARGVMRASAARPGAAVNGPTEPSPIRPQVWTSRSGASHPSGMAGGRGTQLTRPAVRPAARPPRY